MPTSEEISAAQTKNGGWTKKQLAEWGVPWPPPKGWRRKLIKESEETETDRLNAAFEHAISK